MEKRCPADQSELVSQGKAWACPTCGAHYRVQGHCMDCGAEMERLQACGASNWFCPQCNELKSRTRVRTSLARD
ncbi:MAG: zinc ribbon domain-containing protein [Paludibacterium sp.]|uniref:zinc ribbon domain-containing protein n=1 Tax=Paludibacterium sp. TaxID=1917523 RepID=UPI0025F955C8|nr:zinc ribbon domain-containing protein [Paludibacterium sp.]MBV8049275.1 zinc ribbon domain-containing protein [Paludibacterium sp.]MBV8649051.1 zinc ribbon domain-containing protein [Paludibacterium sp.]